MTTPATTHDVTCTAAIQDDLLAQNLGPATHLVDEGSMEVDLLMTSHQRGIDVVGPVPSHKSWQSRTDGAFDHTQFQINWETQQATCPAGKTSVRSVARKTTRGTPNVLFAFSLDDCGACAVRDCCTRAKDVGRTLTVYPQTEYAAQEAARQRQTTADYKALYAQRAGIEGTISQGVRTVGMRQSRYRGLERTRLEHVATAAALNVIRATTWLMGARPEPTRKSPLRALAT